MAATIKDLDAPVIRVGSIETSVHLLYRQTLSRFEIELQDLLNY